MQLERDTADRLMIALFHLAGLALACHLVLAAGQDASIPFLRQLGFLMAIGHLTTLAGATWYLDLLRLGSTVGWPLGIVLVGLSSLGGQDLRCGAMVFLAGNAALYWMSGRLAACSVSLVPSLAFDRD
jgi:hypothetical protein